MTALDIQSQSAVRCKACRDRRGATFKSQGVSNEMRGLRDPERRRGASLNLATSQQRQSAHEAKHKHSQGWYTGSTPVRAANFYAQKSCLMKYPSTARRSSCIESLEFVLITKSQTMRLASPYDLAASVSMQFKSERKTDSSFEQ